MSGIVYRILNVEGNFPLTHNMHGNNASDRKLESGDPTGVPQSVCSICYPSRIQLKDIGQVRQEYLACQ